MNSRTLGSAFTGAVFYFIAGILVGQALVTEEASTNAWFIAIELILGGTAFILVAISRVLEIGSKT